MGRTNYEFRSWMLNKHPDYIKQIKKARIRDFAMREYYENGVVSYAFKHPEKYPKGTFDLMNEAISQDVIYGIGGLAGYKEAMKISVADFQRQKRLKENVREMLLLGTCIFLTLTFSDDTLAKTSPKTRRKLVTRYLKSFNTKYIANIDFGSKNHREHYHAIILIDKVDYKPWRKYGNINGQKIRNKDIQIDSTKLAKYIAKLSNHAIKETCRRGALIYSRT